MSSPAHHDRLLVIAPHPDDDAIGCGGTLARAVALGRRCDIAYVTDGGASHPHSRAYPRERLRDVREAEARDALAILGVSTEPTFLRARDGELATLAELARAELVASLAAVVEATRPHAIFVPWRRDPHPDHVATAALVRDALLASVAAGSATTYAYGVWLAQRGTVADAPRDDECAFVDVALAPDEIERKRRAILAHRSQATGLIADDPNGFRITEGQLERWLVPVERFFVTSPTSDRSHPIGRTAPTTGDGSR